jgi:hypothetical protein
LSIQRGETTFYFLLVSKFENIKTYLFLITTTKMIGFFTDYPLIIQLWYDENEKRKIISYNIKTIDDIFTILHNLGLILSDDEVNSINNVVPLILNNTIVRHQNGFFRQDSSMEKKNIGFRIYKNNYHKYDDYRCEYTNDGFITLYLETFQTISPSIIEYNYKTQLYNKTIDISEIVIFDNIETKVGFKLKNDSFLNRNFLNNKIIKISLDNEHPCAGFILTQHDFQDEITDKFINVNCIVYCCPYIPPHISNDFNEDEIKEIIRENKLSNRIEEQSKYPWKTLEDISYPEFDRNPKFPTYSEQLYYENDFIQLKRTILLPKWELWNTTQTAMKLPNELTLVIKEILVG